MKKFLPCLLVLLASCAHNKLKSPDDLQINKSYPMLNAASPDQTKCELKVQNAMTVVPTPQGLILPMELLKGTKAYVCGSVDCSKTEGKVEGTEFYCGPFELLLDPADLDKEEG